MKKTWLLIIVGFMIGILPGLYIADKATSLEQQNKEKALSNDALDITSSLNFKVDPKVISYIRIYRDKYEDLGKDPSMLFLDAYSPSGECKMKLFEGMALLNKFSSRVNDVILVVLEDGSIYLSAHEKVKNTYTKDEIIKGINDLNLSSFVQNFPKIPEPVQNNRDTWKR